MSSRLLRCLASTAVLTASLLALAGCGGTVVGVVRTGVPRPAREPACALTLESIDPAERQPGGRFGAGGEYEQIGVVTLGTTLGTDPMSEDVLREVRPRACAMGGEVIALMSAVSSRRGYGQTDIAFSVWAHRVARPTAPQAYQGARTRQRPSAPRPALRPLDAVEHRGALRGDHHALPPRRDDVAGA